MNKLLVYIDTMQLGGAQRVLNNLMSYFAERGKRIILVNDVFPYPNAKEYVIDPRVQRRFLCEGLSSNAGTLGKNLHRIKRLRKIIKQEQPDTVVSFLGPPNIRMLTASLGLKTRKIVSVRNDPYREYGAGLKKCAARMLFRLADGCVFQTEDAAAYFPVSVQKKSEIIYNPVHDRFYAVHWTGNAHEIAVIGRLQPQKNPLLALEAFRMIQEDFPEVKLVFYGDEELAKYIVQKSGEYGLSQRVLVAGKTDDVPAKLAGASVYLLSSDYEGMPNALMEAMAAGVPAVSTDCPCGGPKTLIQNETQGILVPCRDARAMAAALRKVLNDPQLQQQMHDAEKQRADAFRASKIIPQWAKYIESISFLK